jgi:hypothetical protein
MIALLVTLMQPNLLFVQSFTLPVGKIQFFSHRIDNLQYSFARSILFSTTSLPSETDAPNNDQSTTEQILDLHSYSNSRAFNLALEDVAADIANRKKNNKIDVISRATIAEALVSKLEQSVEEGTATFNPDIVTYNTLMKVWAKAAQTLAEGRGRGDINEVMHAMDDVPDELNHGGIYTAKDAAERSLAILRNVEHKYMTGESDICPNSFGYNIVMDGISKSNAKEASDMIEDLYNRMVRLSTIGAQGKDEDGEPFERSDSTHWTSIHPDTITYSIMIEVLGLSEDPDSMKRVDKCLEIVQKEYEETNKPELKPVIRLANSAINAYLKHSNRNSRGDKAHANSAWQIAKKVNDIYNTWDRKYKETGDVDYQPDITAVTQIIESYSRCGDVAATERGEILFENAYKAWKEGGNERLKPSSKAFTVMINAWAKTRDGRSPSKAEELIQRMEEIYAEDCKRGEGSTSTTKPSIRTYTAAITAWARSRDYTKPQRALKILKKVSDQYRKTNDESIKPNLFTYNAVIDACARCNGNHEQQANALKIAFAVNKAILAAKLEPNSITYSTLLKAANNLLPEGDVRNQVLRAVFEKAVSSGYVDYNVLKAFDQASDRELYHELLKVAEDKNGFVTMKNLPDEWKKNVLER